MTPSTRAARRRPSLAWLALAALLLTPACSVHRHWSHRSLPKLTLRSTTADDGTERRFVLEPSHGGPPRIDETVRSWRPVAFLGIETRTLDGDFAACLGVPSWKGVYVERVVAGSAAAEAGLRKGDILRRLAGTEVATSEHVSEITQGELVPGMEVVVEVQRWATGASEGELTLKPVEVPLTVGSRSVEQVTTRAHKLATSRAVLRHTGLQLGEVPPALAVAVFDRDDTVVLVSDVRSGSPGYLAGFRRGDRVVSVDGEPVHGLDDVRRAVLLRALDEGWPVPADELEGGAPWAADEPPEGRLELAVEGPLGPHARRVRLEEDLDDDLDVHVPILLSVESDVDRTEWAFLDFILQFGATYESTYLPSDTRVEQSYTEYSMLPFGMFEYRSSPQWTEWTFFWFITFAV